MPTIGKQGDELVIRCKNCGDSVTPSHGHLYVNYNKGVYNCFKCGYRGSVDTPMIMSNFDSFFDSMENEVQKTPKESELKIIGDTSYTGRHTKLPVKTIEYNNMLWDGFQTVNANNEPMGVHLRRNKPKMSHQHGKKGISYTHTLTSSSDKPLNVVEGAYDVVLDDSVCVYGFLSDNVIHRYLKLQYLNLIPDGDVWESKTKRSVFLRSLFNLYYSDYVHIHSIWVLPEGKDIDELDDEYTNLTIVENHEILEFIEYLVKGNFDDWNRKY